MAVVVKNVILGGHIDITLIGSEAEITAEVERINRCYPTPGYGTWFNWPPNGTNKTYKVPQKIADDMWTAYGDRMTSCE